MTLTRARTIQYVGILLVLGLIAVGYWYFNVRAGVKTNTTAGSAVGDGGLGAGLVGYWKLDEGTGTSAASTSVNTLTGTLTNGPTWTTGQVRSAVDFDGTNDYITVADNAAVDFGDTDAFTLTGWFNRDTFTTDDVIIAKANDGALSLGYIVVIDDATDQLGFIAAVDGSNYYASGSSSAFTATGWHHFAITWNGAAAAVYIDGVSNEQTPGSSGSVGNLSNSLTFNIGSESDGGNPFDGKLDEIRVYDRMLSSSEITDLYKLTVPTAVDTGLVGYWAFGADDIRSTLVSDRSGARNTGTLVNAPTKTIGRIGQAFNFVSASTQYINAGSGAIVDDIVNLSSCAWVKPNSSLTTYGDVVTKYTNAGVGWQMLLDYATLSNLGISFYRVFSSTAGHWFATAVLPYNQWSHVCVTYNNSSTTNDPVFYVNGIQVSTYENQAPVGTASAEGTGDLYIGAYNNAGSPGEMFDGVIDEPRVYNRIITAAEVKTLYDAGTANKVNTSAAQPEGTGNMDAGLVGYWKLDEGTGTSAADASVNATTAGTLTNGPTWGTGRIGSAVVFDGTNDYIALSDPSNGVLDFGDTDDMTISGWFNRSTFTTIDTIVSKWDGVNPGYRVYIDDSNDALHFQLFDGTDTYAIDANGLAITAAGWHHFVAVWDQDSPANSELYLDGRALSATDSGTIGNIGTLANTVALSIGETPGTGFSFAGSLDEFRIYDRVFSAEEVNVLYNQTAATGVDTSLRGYWSFNAPDTPGTTAYDRSGARNTGTLTNGPAKGIGRIGQALTLDGTNDYVTMSDIAALDGLTAVTASAWVKTTVLGVEKHIVNKANCGGTTDSGVFELFGGFSAVSKPEFAFYKSGGSPNTYNAVSSVSIDDGNWHLVTGTYDGVAVRIYVDGVETGRTTATSITAPSVTYPVEVGGCTATPDYPWNGSIDEVRLYSRALSAAEVKAMYDIGAPDKVNTSASTPQGTGNPNSGLVGYWKFDENTGTSAADATANANTGTLTNGPTWGTGRIGSAVDFDGSNDYVTATGASTDNLAQKTLCVWVNPDTTQPDSFSNVIQKGTAGAYWDLYLVPSDPFGFGTSLNSGTAYIEIDTNNIPSGQWSHICGVQGSANSADFYLYQNGVEVGGTRTGSTTFPTDTGVALRIGAESATTFRYAGLIDEARVYDRALSAQEIANLYRLTAPTGTDTGLVGYWSFNGQDTNATTAYDRSGVGNDGTLTNSPTKVIGKLGQALNFDGTNDYVNAGSATVIDNLVNLSACAWVNPDTIPNGYSSIIAQMDNGGAEATFGFHDNGTADYIEYYRSFSGTIGEWHSDGNIVPLGAWSHICVTYNDSSVANDPIIYLNGAQIGVVEVSTPVGTASSTAGGDYYIGALDNGGAGAEFFDGKLDEVRVYNRALSASEIQALYNSGR